MHYSVVSNAMVVHCAVVSDAIAMQCAAVSDAIGYKEKGFKRSCIVLWCLMQ
jgi:hypothetical protein